MWSRFNTISYFSPKYSQSTTRTNKNIIIIEKKCICKCSLQNGCHIIECSGLIVYYIHTKWKLTRKRLSVSVVYLSWTNKCQWLRPDISSYEHNCHSSSVEALQLTHINSWRWTRPALGQIMAIIWTNADLISIGNFAIRNIFQWKLNQSTKVSIQENELKKWHLQNDSHYVSAFIC